MVSIIILLQVLIIHMKNIARLTETLQNQLWQHGL